MSTREPITPIDGVIPMNIGLAPRVLSREEVAALNAASDIKLAITPPRPARPDRIILPGETEAVGVSEAADRELVDVHSETLNSLTWPTYLAWRKTKTRPYDYANAILATSGAKEGEDLHDQQARLRGLEEIDQATLEMIGEVAELGELFAEHGPLVFWESLRDKLIDECGDIFFCASWALDAWGANPLNSADDLEMIRVAPDNDLVAFAAVIAGNTIADVMASQQFVGMLGGMILSSMLTAQTSAGMTANSFKKLRFQGRVQDVEKQVGRIANVLIAVNKILVVANSSVEEALKVNMRKLDARRPGGYNPAVPGGIRTGEGA